MNKFKAILWYWVVVLLALIWFVLGMRQSLACDRWSSRDSALLVTSTALRVIDWGQTRHISRNPTRFYEANPLLGRHPSVGRVDRHFTATILGTALVTCLLPSELRPYWLGTDIVVGLVITGRNHSLGIRVEY